MGAINVNFNLNVNECFSVPPTNRAVTHYKVRRCHLTATVSKLALFELLSESSHFVTMDVAIRSLIQGLADFESFKLHCC